MEFATFILSIISIVFTTGIGFWNIYLQINYKKKEEKRIEADRKKEVFDARPRLEIVEHYNDYELPLQKRFDYYDIDTLNTYIESYKDGDFYYSSNSTKKENWVSASFKFKNIGRTEIDHIYICTNNVKTTSLFNVKNDIHEELIANHILSYSVGLDKFIKTNEEFTLRINFIKDEITNNLFSATITIWFTDVYGKMWAQSLFVNQGKIYDSKQESIQMFRDCTDENKAIDCFNNPYLW